MPNIPDVSPAMDINREDALNLMLAALAFEELGLAHLINAEAEKIQFAVGTLEKPKPHTGAMRTPTTPPAPGTPPPPEGGGNDGGKKPELKDIIEMNKTVNEAMRNIIKKQMLIQFELEDILAILKVGKDK